MASPERKLENESASISHTVSSVTDLPIPSQKSARDSQQKPSPKTPPLLRGPPRIQHRPQDDIEVQSLLQGDDTLRQDLEGANTAYLANLSLKPQPHCVRLPELPVEVQEGIIDNLAGHIIGIIPASPASTCGSRNWSTAMRHPRRKQLSDLALVSRTWRRLIQERLYRHIKVKGTYAGLAECSMFFSRHAHLSGHVRHFEVWVPVWEVKARRATNIPPIPSAFTPRPDMRGARVNGRTATVIQDITDMTQAFQQASQNVTLEDVFEHTRSLFPNVYVLTIEGGHGKRTPIMRALRRRLGNSGLPHGDFGTENQTVKLPVNPQIGSLVLKGAWNIIREPSDFYLLSSALPNLREYHCTYAKPKTQAYEATCCVLKYFPPSISHLNICLEGLTGKPSVSVEKWRRLYSTYHICTDIGRILPDLENFSYTGRICSSLFKDACATARNHHDTTSRLKSIDLIVRNCCRGKSSAQHGHNDATGIYQIDFINAFEQLVVEAVRALSVFTSLHYLRIRFLDLDSPNPLLNPYFHLQGNNVTGIWSSEILALLKVARPSAEYDCLDVAECGGGGIAGSSGSGRPGVAAGDDQPGSRRGTAR
ncbi:MAG: hypothetical protein Q9222_007507 [Ikaeria aurantiellina]